MPLGGDLEGAPLAVWYGLLVAAILATVLAWVRYRRAAARGDEVRSGRLRTNLPYGIFVVALIAVRLILRS